MNLVSNAAEAMPCGGTDPDRDDKPVCGLGDSRLRPRHRGRVHRPESADTGIGIAQKDIKKIFEPFYTKKIMGRSGTGLGMAVVWGTVKDHNGYIDIESVEGKGTTFTLYFPVNRAVLSRKTRRSPSSNSSPRERPILVVDDVAGAEGTRIGHAAQAGLQRPRRSPAERRPSSI